MSSEIEQKFWSRVQKTETCWLWVGSHNKDGYGSFTFQGKYYYTHRYAYTLLCGAIPSGLFVCHSCDVRNCVHPDHLFVGTNKDNVDDRERKGRHHDMRGERHQNSKLTDALVRQIRARYALGETQKQLATAFGVGTTAIQKIVTRERWGHVV